MLSHAIYTCLRPLCLFLLFLSACTKPSTAEKMVHLVADGILQEGDFGFIDIITGTRYESPMAAPPTAHLNLTSTYNDWRYWSGVINLALWEAGEYLHEPTYTQFVSRNIAFAFDNHAYFQAKYQKENKWEYPFGQFFLMEELDDCGAMGASVIEVAQRDPQQRYLNYLQRAADHIFYKQARLEDGTLVRAFPQKWTIWADDLYMICSFLCRMPEMPGILDGVQGLNDAIRQVINYHHYLFDEKLGLMYHNWYSSTQRHGVACWGRANGWAILAQCDLLDHLPPNHPQRDTLLFLFRRHIEGVLGYQDSSGLWHQLIDKPDSFLETSCSAIFTYALLHGVRLNYLPQKYLSAAQRGWQGLVRRVRPDGKIEGICTGTGIYDDLQEYYRRPTPLNDPHGVGFVLMAGLEIMRIAHEG